MERANIGGVELEFEVRGSGEPVLFMHCGFVADGFAPLLPEPALSKGYRLINYHRKGYGGSQRPQGLLSISEQAADAHTLLQYLEITQAHLVGHSFGGNVALEFALDYPEMVHSLALLEPALGFAFSPATTQVFMQIIGQAISHFEAGNKAEAVDSWLKGAFGPDYRQVLDRVLPGAFDQAVKDADTVFQVEAASLQQWLLTADDFKRIRQPVLSVFHVQTGWAGFQEVHEALLAWLPQAETLVLPNATHLLQMMNPRSMAEGLASFFARHPLLLPA